MAVRNYSSTTPITTLTAPVAPGDVTFTIAASSSVFPAVPFTIIVAPDTVNEEVVDVTAASGGTLTVVRGVDGTTARSHVAGTSVIHGISARDFAEANAHVNVTSGNPHGTTAADVGAAPAAHDHDATYVQKAIVDAKGDLIVASGADAPMRVAVGADGFVLTADSTQSSGVTWAPAAAGGVGLDSVFLLMGA